jgi:hypothetical protein
MVVSYQLFESRRCSDPDLSHVVSAQVVPAGTIQQTDQTPRQTLTPAKAGSSTKTQTVCTATV